MEKTEAYRQTLATLRRDLSEVEERVVQLRDAIKVIERLIPQEDLFKGNVMASPRLHGRLLASVPMIQAAEMVLREVGRPLHVMEMVKLMKEAGFPYDRDDEAMRASLTGSLERRETVERVAPATYALRIWSQNGKHEKQEQAADTAE